MYSTQTKVKLRSGNSIPLIGMGTFQIRGRKLIYDVLNSGLGSGYRLFDTAAVYGNEEDIGFALKELLANYNLKREDIFVTSKLSPSDHGDRANRAIEKSLANLGMRYLDLYLIHWPGVSGIPTNSNENGTIRKLSWQYLIKAKNSGYVKSIGVSNYTLKHMEELLLSCEGVKPDVLQSEWHPHYHEVELHDLCKKEGIFFQAYSSFGTSGNNALINDDTVQSVANSLGKSPTQVLLRWSLQQGIGVIPKAKSKEHIEMNIELNFDIPEDKMTLLSNINMGEKYAWDPSIVV